MVCVASAIRFIGWLVLESSFAVYRLDFFAMIFLVVYVGAIAHC